MDADSNITVKNTTGTGLYYAMLTFNSVTYQVNVVSDASNATDTFAPENGVMVQKVFANTLANLKFPDGA